MRKRSRGTRKKVERCRSDGVSRLELHGGISGRSGRLSLPAPSRLFRPLPACFALVADMTSAQRREFGQFVRKTRKKLGYKTSGQWAAIVEELGGEKRSTRILEELERTGHVGEDTIQLVTDVLEQLGVPLPKQAPTVNPNPLQDGHAPTANDPAVARMLKAIEDDPYLDRRQRLAIRTHYLGLLEFKREAEQAVEPQTTGPPLPRKRSVPRGRKASAKPTSPTSAGTKR